MNLESCGEISNVIQLFFKRDTEEALSISPEPLSHAPKWIWGLTEWASFYQKVPVSSFDISKEEMQARTSAKPSKGLNFPRGSSSDSSTSVVRSPRSSAREVLLRVTSDRKSDRNSRSSLSASPPSSRSPRDSSGVSSSPKPSPLFKKKEISPGTTRRKSGVAPESPPPATRKVGFSDEAAAVAERKFQFSSYGFRFVQKTKEWDRVFIGSDGETLSMYLDQKKDPVAYLGIKLISNIVYLGKEKHLHILEVHCKNGTRRLMGFRDFDDCRNWRVYLQSRIANHIKESPFSQIRGHLFKRGPKVQDAFKIRWFLLDLAVVRWFRDEKDKKSLGYFQLGDVQEVDDCANGAAPPPECPEKVRDTQTHRDKSLFIDSFFSLGRRSCLVLRSKMPEKECGNMFYAQCRQQRSKCGSPLFEMLLCKRAKIFHSRQLVVWTTRHLAWKIEGVI
jgi:hypothetical protein